MENKAAIIHKDLKGEELNEYVERILKCLSEKEQIIQAQIFELESLNALISFYRDQFDPKKCEKCEDFQKTLEILHFTIKNLEKEAENRESLIKELTGAKEENVRKSEENRNENRRLTNENKLFKSQLQALKEKSAVNEKYIDNLKRDVKSFAEDKERMGQMLKESEEKLLIISEKQLNFTSRLSNDDILVDEELEKLQHGLDSLDALNQNIQSSLSQFQISHAGMKHPNSRNISMSPKLAISRSIDISRSFMSPKNNGKNPSFSFIWGHSQQKMTQSQATDLGEIKTTIFKEEAYNERVENRRFSYNTNTNANVTSTNNNRLAIETISEEEKDIELDLQEKKEKSQHFQRRTLRKTTVKRQKCKSMAFLQSNNVFFTEQNNAKSKKKTKSLTISNQPLDAAALNDLLNLSNLETDSFGILKILLDGNLSLVKDFQNRLSMNAKLINKNLTELTEFLQKDVTKEETQEFLLRQRNFNRDIGEHFKDYLLNASDMIKVLIETGIFAQKGQQSCENLNIAMQEQEIEIKNKLEEIVKLHQSIISLEKKEISFEEDITEVYDKYMIVIGEHDPQWKTLDRFKKFTKMIESYVQEKSQIKELLKENEGFAREVEEMKKKIRDLQKENQRKTEGITRVEGREKNIRKDRDFFYSQLMFFKKKVLEQEFLGIDIENIQKDETEVVKFLKKYQNVDCSIKTLVENLISYEENKGKEVSF